MEYEYKSFNLPGNLHELATYMNTAELRGWQLVAAEFAGMNTVAIVMRPLPAPAARTGRVFKEYP